MKVQINRSGNLQLRWSFSGERYYYSLGLKDVPANRLKAEKLAAEIQSDIATGNFDISLSKYRNPSNLTCLALFQNWLKFKANFVDPRTIDWYRLTEVKLARIGNLSVSSLKETHALEFLFTLQADQLALETIHRYLENLKACWDWAIKKQLVNFNPWIDLLPLIKPPKKPSPRPFTKKEVDLILQGFAELYPDFLLFVEFLFKTGCRTGEARALLWNCLDSSCFRCEINTQLSRLGIHKLPKGGKTRVIYLSPSLQEKLRKHSRHSKYVFSFHGRPINENTFRNYWRKVLKKMLVRYRKPYSTRATFISHALENKVSPHIPQIFKQIELGMKL